MQNLGEGAPPEGEGQEGWPRTKQHAQTPVIWRRQTRSISCPSKIAKGHYFVTNFVPPCSSVTTAFQAVKLGTQVCHGLLMRATEFGDAWAAQWR